jgi:hypothetical protein
MLSRVGEMQWLGGFFSGMEGAGCRCGKISSRKPVVFCLKTKVPEEISARQADAQLSIKLRATIYRYFL